MADLIYEVHNHLARITLNRPKQLNCFSEEMIRLWTEALEDVRDNDDVYALLLSGNGKAFCAGGDVKAMAAGDGFFESHEDISSTALARKNSLWKGIQRIPLLLEEIDKPVVAKIHGAAVGAGLDMALMCDVRIAGESASMSESYFNAGIVPGDGGAYFLPRLVGRVWTREEVERLGDICLKHQVIIVSDEIHADFVFEGKHQVLVDLKDEYKDITVTCTSPGKTFNLAGLQISNIIIPNAGLRKEFQHQVTAAGYSQVGAPGIFALIATYTQGEEWYQAMKQYVKSNIDFLHTWMAEHLPQIKVTKTEGTYLVWMDFRALGLSDKELKELIEDKAEVWLDGGAIFGEPGSGFERINVACQRATLVEALNRIEKAVKENVHG